MSGSFPAARDGDVSPHRTWYRNTAHGTNHATSFGTRGSRHGDIFLPQSRDIEVPHINVTAARPLEEAGPLPFRDLFLHGVLEPPQDGDTLAS